VRIADSTCTLMQPRTTAHTLRPAWFSATNAADLAERGFTLVHDICTPADLAVLRTELPLLFARRAGSPEGKFYDMLGRDGSQRATLPTLLNPSQFAPALGRLECRARTLQIARWLLGDAVVLNLEHAILKPAQYGSPTPWHQDEAYRREPEFRYSQVSFWFPLDDCADESGCLRFVPGSNQGEVLQHRSFLNDAGTYALECAEPIPFDRVVPLPVCAGDCSVHTGRTLHGAGPNLSLRPRFAYILEYEAPPVPLGERRQFAWHSNRRPPSRAIRARWLRRGGIFVEVFRRLKDGLFVPRRLRFEWRRSLRVLKNLFSGS